MSRQDQLTRIVHTDPYPIAYEDLANLGIESRLIPFIITIALQAEQSPDDSTPLTLAEAECLLEILDKVRLPVNPTPPAY